MTTSFATPEPTPAIGADNGIGTAGGVLGIIGICLAWVPFLGGILGVLATVFGAIGYSRSRKGTASNGGFALTGLILGVITIVFWPVMLGIAAAAGA